jgi:hypothetical protein
MLKNIKRYVYKKLLDYHIKKSDYCYSKIDEWNADDNIYWGNKTTRHTMKCVKLTLKLKKLEED